MLQVEPRLHTLKVTEKMYFQNGLLIWKLNESALEGEGRNEWKMVEMALLISFCQIYSNKLPKRSLSSFKISKFEAIGFQRTCEANPAGENSSFIFTYNV